MSIIYRILSSFSPVAWRDTSKFKVLIEINKYFSKNKWEVLLSKLNNETEIIYFENKYQGYKLLPKADAAFIFGSNNNCDYSSLRMIYYGVSQPDIICNNNSIKYYASGFSDKAIAQYCLTYSLVLLYSVNEYLHKLQNKQWSQNKLSEFKEISILNKSIGILGLGKNGKSIADLFKKVGCKVYGYDINEKQSDFVDVFCKSKNELLAESDVLIIAVNSSNENIGSINRESFSLMKSSSYLINISRGNIINEKDLYYALKNKIIKGAVLDVTLKEPLSKYNKLWNLKNIIITPHIAGNVNMFVNEIMADFYAKLYEFLDNNNV